MGGLGKLFKSNGFEQRIEQFARSGKGDFPQEISDFTFVRSEMGLRTGYFDIFKATLSDGSEAEVILPVLTTQKLYGRDIPDIVRDALIDCFESHNVDNPDAAYHKRYKQPPSGN